MNLCSLSLFNSSMKLKIFDIPKLILLFTKKFSLQTVPGDEIPYDMWETDFTSGCFCYPV